MYTNDFDFQLVPPGIHWRNAAERAIRTFKNHFIAALCSVDKNFPIHLWDQLLPQAEITLNLLRGSRINPKLSAWAQVHGTFDFNRTLLGPPGCRVLAHEKPDKRKTWAPQWLACWPCPRILPMLQNLDLGNARPTYHRYPYVVPQQSQITRQFIH